MSLVEAGCTVHPNQPFTTICPRCGTYMCGLCSESGTFELCAACRQRTGTGSFPLRREQWTFDALLRYSFEAYKKNFATVTLATLISFVIVIALNGASVAMSVALRDQPIVGAILQIVFTIIQSLAQGLFTLGMWALGLAIARGERPQLSMLFGQSSRLVAWLIQSFLMFLAFLPGFSVMGIAAAVSLAVDQLYVTIGAIIIATMVGGSMFVYVFLGLTFANTELVANPGIGALSAMRNAWNLMEGKRGELFVAMLIAAGFVLVGMMMCGVGVIFSLGFASVMFSSLYLTLKNGNS